MSLESGHLFTHTHTHIHTLYDYKIYGMVLEFRINRRKASFTSVYIDMRVNTFSTNNNEACGNLTNIRREAVPVNMLILILFPHFLTEGSL